MLYGKIVFADVPSVGFELIKRHCLVGHGPFRFGSRGQRQEVSDSECERDLTLGTFSTVGFEKGGDQVARTMGS